jgi:hypothetical protein
MPQYVKKEKKWKFPKFNTVFKRKERDLHRLSSGWAMRILAMFSFSHRLTLVYVCCTKYEVEQTIVKKELIDIRSDYVGWTAQHSAKRHERYATPPEQQQQEQEHRTTKSRDVFDLTTQFFFCVFSSLYFSSLWVREPNERNWGRRSYQKRTAGDRRGNAFVDLVSVRIIGLLRVE